MSGRLSSLFALALLATAPVGAQHPDTVAMARAMRLLDAACAADRGATWSHAT